MHFETESQSESIFELSSSSGVSNAASNAASENVKRSPPQLLIKSQRASSLRENVYLDEQDAKSEQEVYSPTKSETPKKKREKKMNAKAEKQVRERKSLLQKTALENFYKEMLPGEKLNSLRSRQFMSKLGLTRDVVYKYLWDMKQKKDGLKRMASKEQLREEIDDLAALLKIDITPQAEAIVQQDSPFATRDTLKIVNKQTLNHSPASCELELQNDHQLDQNVAMKSIVDRKMSLNSMNVEQSYNQCQDLSEAYWMKRENVEADAIQSQTDQEWKQFEAMAEVPEVAQKMLKYLVDKYSTPQTVEDSSDQFSRKVTQASVTTSPFTNYQRQKSLNSPSAFIRVKPIKIVQQKNTPTLFQKIGDGRRSNNFERPRNFMQSDNDFLSHCQTIERTILQRQLARTQFNQQQMALARNNFLIRSQTMPRANEE